MILSEVKTLLKHTSRLEFKLPNGELVPSHFHVTEVGKVSKHFIDCGGVERKEEVVSFQLWNANDYDHRLHPERLLDIINLSESKLGLSDSVVEVEYQGETIGKYGLDYSDGTFQLTMKETDCLAKDNCGIPEEKPRVKLSEIQNSGSCAPGSGCC
ncbi:MAG TPA: hypothetical protein DHU89_01240 [Flavobacteriales bacterium]|nr:hypothetical protein [Flavobacteriales bacterium]